MAMKSTYVEKNVNGETVGVNIFKDPVTDNGTKKSAKGLIKVVKENGTYKLFDECTWDEVNSDDNELKVVFRNGEFTRRTTLTEIREILNNE